MRPKAVAVVSTRLLNSRAARADSLAVFPSFPEREFSIFRVLFILPLCLIAASPVFANGSTMGEGTGVVYSDRDTGYVGIGTTRPESKLDVAGDVRIGTSARACTPVNAGTLRYTQGRLKLCDGASWRNVSLEKGQ